MTTLLDAETAGDAAADAAGFEDLLAAKGDQRVGVCIPARDEAGTIGSIVEVVELLRGACVVDELVVVDDGSTDGTAALAAAVGATVIPSPRGPGKGQALTSAIGATGSDILVFLDGDVTSFSSHFVTRLLLPLLADPHVQLVKPTYRRPLGGDPDEGGRVTELLARPLLRRFFPELASLSQPLAGECALRRGAVDGLVLDDGYGIEIGLLLDVYRRHGRSAIAEVDLGERTHRNRPLHQLRPHADDVLEAVLRRVP